MADIQNCRCASSYIYKPIQISHIRGIPVASRQEFKAGLRSPNPDGEVSYFGEVEAADAGMSRIIQRIAVKLAFLL
ncbi:hypothetical protein LPU83_pLPU83b_0077 (plasmid) [Rhizobium favelukesii]|uniref:Uncharacterized protein n=1 Tax=Rhizobium favelukesii TaxID=348824 RepID=W6S0S2_9HYPH|nr:hypothetical protein LPU83_pLPU83b_0077 [Rhizobium favelukesii]